MKSEHVPAEAVRDDLANMYGAGAGGCSNPEAWGRVFDMAPPERAEAFALQAKEYGCRQEIQGHSILWLNEQGQIEATFSFADANDLRAHRAYLDLVDETRSPLSHIVIYCGESYDILKTSAAGLLKHQNEIPSHSLRSLARDPRPRKELVDIAGSGVWNDEHVVEVCNAPRQTAVEELERLAQKYDCTQKLEGEAVQWHGANGQLEAMFFIGDDNDLQFIRQVYARVDESGCPVTWLLLRVTRKEGRVVEMLCLHRNHYMALLNVCGPWEE